MSKRIAIIGAGDLGQQIAHYILEDDAAKVVGFFDDTVKTQTQVGSIPVLGAIATISEQYSKGVFDALLIGIGYKHLLFKQTLSKKHENIPFATYVHSSAWVDTTATIASGTIIFPGCIIDKNVKLKENVLLNIGCSISHDSSIGANSFLSPRVAVAGFTNVGERCSLGINCTVIDNIKITQATSIAAGAVVTKDCEKSGLYVGVPATLKKNYDTF